MRTNNISDGKLKKLTGHKSQEMTDHYTHFKADDYQDVKKIQAKGIDNKEWEKEFDNAITVIREMSGVDLKS